MNSVCQTLFILVSMLCQHLFRRYLLSLNKKLDTLFLFHMVSCELIIRIISLTECDIIYFELKHFAPMVGLGKLTGKLFR